MEGWSFGLQMEPLSGLQDCLAALEWTARIQQSGLASYSSSTSAPFTDAKLGEQFGEEASLPSAIAQAVDHSRADHVESGAEVGMQSGNLAAVRDHGLTSAEPANGSIEADSNLGEYLLLC